MKRSTRDTERIEVFENNALQHLKHNVFQLPDAYFDTLLPAVFERINLETSIEVAHFTTISLPYTIPDNYFENLPIILLDKVHAANAIVEGKQVLFKNIANPFHVPEAYFEKLPSLLLAKINDTSESAQNELHRLSPFLNDLKPVLPFEVPHGYFETLAEQALEINRFENEEEDVVLSETLASLKGKLPYQTPDGYFEPQSNKHHEQAEPIVIPFESRRKQGFRKWLIGGVAAAVIAILSFEGWIHFGNPNNGAPDPHLVFSKYEKQLNQVPKAAVAAYIESHLEEFDENTLANSVVNQGKSINEVKALDHISDEAIKAYLQGDM